MDKEFFKSLADEIAKMVEEQVTAQVAQRMATIEQRLTTIENTKVQPVVTVQPVPVQMTHVVEMKPRPREPRPERSFEFYTDAKGNVTGGRVKAE